MSDASQFAPPPADAPVAEQPAQVAEAVDDGKLTVQWKNLTFRVDPSSKWPLRVLRLLDTRPADALQTIFGTEQYAAFENHPEATIGDVQVVLGDLEKAAGLAPGESVASPAS